MQVSGESSPQTTFTFDAASRIVTSIQGSALTTFTFDRNGNQTVVAPAGSAATTLTYDAENRQKEYREMVAGALSITTYQYDGDGLKRLAVNPDATRTSFVWDGQDYLGDA